DWPRCARAPRLQSRGFFLHKPPARFLAPENHPMIFRVCLLAVAFSSACLTETAVQGGDQPDQVIGERGDAQLADVCFVDRANGWAVGDRGVIWHTADGGAHWQQQNSPVNCPLHSVFFLDAARGWAVGGAEKPFTRASAGAVLRTNNG